MTGARFNLRFARGLALALGLCASALQVQADSYDALLTRAVAAKEKALEANDPSSWLDAQHLFEAADALRPTAESRYEMGVAAERLQQEDLAVESFELCIERGIGGRAREHASAYVAKHKPGLATLELQGPDGTQISIAGLVRGKLPLERPLVVFPGDTELTLTEPTGESRTQRVQLSPGKRQTLKITPAASPEHPVAPTAPPETKAASEVAAPAPSAPTRATLPSQPPPQSDHQHSPLHGLGVGLVLAGGVAIAAGVPLALISSGRIDRLRSDLSGHCTTLNGPDWCGVAKENMKTQAQEEVDSLLTWKTVRTGTWVALGTGLGAVATGAVLLLAGGSHPATEAGLPLPQVAVDLDPRAGRGEVTVRGHFW